MAKIARSFAHRAPGSTRSCPLPLAALATSAIFGFAPLTAFAKSLRQENASIFYASGLRKPVARYTTVIDAFFRGE